MRKRCYSNLIKFGIHRGIDRAQIANELVKCPLHVEMTKQFSSNYPDIRLVEGTLYPAREGLLSFRS